MKRFLVISLSVLLILPVLLVPCFAAGASEYQFVYDAETGYYLCPVVLPSGSYTGFVSTDQGEFNIQEFDYHPDYYPDACGYLADVILSVSVNDSSFYYSAQIGYELSFDYTVLVLDGVRGDVGVFTFISVPSQETYLLYDLFSVASAVIDWCSQIAQTIVSRPLLLFTVGIFFVGGSIALFSRF